MISHPTPPPDAYLYTLGSFTFKIYYTLFFSSPFYFLTSVLFGAC